MRTTNVITMGHKAYSAITMGHNAYSAITMGHKAYSAITMGHKAYSAITIGHKAYSAITMGHKAYSAITMGHKANLTDHNIMYEQLHTELKGEAVCFHVNDAGLEQQIGRATGRPGDRFIDVGRHHLLTVGVDRVRQGLTALHGLRLVQQVTKLEVLREFGTVAREASCKSSTQKYKYTNN